MRFRGRLLTSVIAILVALVVAAPATATADSTPGRTRVATLRIPHTDAQGNRLAQDIICYVDVYDPFLRSDATVGSHTQVDCTEPMFSIYVENVILWDGTFYPPSLRADYDNHIASLGVDSNGVPCNTGSVYHGAGYVEVVAENGLGDAGEFTSFNYLVC